MTSRRQEEIYNKMHEDIMKITASKRSDYANTDVLSNFKRVGEALKVLRIRELPAPLAYSFTMIILKLDRWINLIIQNTCPKNESVEDTVMDLQNYIDLSEALHYETNTKTP